MDIKFTAGMEDKLDAIAQGEEWQKIIADFYPPFEKNVKMAYSKEKKIKWMKKPPTWFAKNAAL